MVSELRCKDGKVTKLGSKDSSRVKQKESGNILLPLFLYIMHIVVHYIYRKHFAWLYRM